jgi:hypothetical protein
MGTLDAHGRFRVALPEGRLVTLWGRARGFQPHQQALDIPLALDEEWLIDATVDAGAVLTGVVLDAQTRAPVPGAEVWAETFAPQDDSLAPSTRADAFGRFRLEGVEEALRPISNGGTALWFMLLARADGYAPIPARSAVAEPNDAHEYDFEVLVEPVSAVLHGVVRTEAGAPAAHAGVFAVGSQGNPLSVVADEQGEFTLAGLSPGTLGLWLSSGEGALATEFALGTGEQHAEFVLHTGAARLEGRVLDLDGRPAAGVRVAANFNFRANGIAIRLGASESLTDAQGNYALDDLQDGSYGVEVVTQGTALPCAAPRTASVEITAERVARADFVVGPCFTLEGRLDTVGATEALTLQALDPDSGEWCAGARIERDGSFRFEPMLAREHDVVLSRGMTEVLRTRLGPRSGAVVLSAPR